MNVCVSLPHDDLPNQHLRGGILGLPAVAVGAVGIAEGEDFLNTTTLGGIQLIHPVAGAAGAIAGVAGIAGPGDGGGVRS